MNKNRIVSTFNRNNPSEVDDMQFFLKVSCFNICDDETPFFNSSRNVLQGAQL